VIRFSQSHMGLIGSYLRLFTADCPQALFRTNRA
jgi:hypothetical protein